MQSNCKVRGLPYWQRRLQNYAGKGITLRPEADDASQLLTIFPSGPMAVFTFNVICENHITITNFAPSIAGEALRDSLPPQVLQVIVGQTRP